jgi:soluble lytic murein transglycosylase-like protein
MVFFDRPAMPYGMEAAPPAGAQVDPPAPSLFGRRTEAYGRAVGLIREERYADALAFIRRSGRDIRGWDGMMSLEAALLSREDPQGALSLYDRILDSDSRGLHWSRALAGYKFLLNDLRAEGDYAALFRLVKCLSFEWRNVEARELVAEALLDPGLPGATRDELSRMAAVMAMRHGDFAAAEAYFDGRTDRQSLQWLSTLKVRQGDFTGAALARRAAAGTMKGRQRARELSRAFGILARGGLALEAQAVLDEFPEIKGAAPDWQCTLGIAWLAARDPSRAEGLLARETGVKGARGARAQYFRGRAMEMLLNHDEAVKEYGRAASGPYGYYHLLARGRLAKLHGEPLGLNAPGVRFAALLDTPTGDDRDTMAFQLWMSERLAQPLPDRGVAYSPRGGPGDPVRARASAFHYRGRGDRARAAMELRHTPGAVPRAGEAVPEEMARLAMIATDAGDYSLAMNVLSRVPDPRKGAAGPFRWNHPPAHAGEALLAWRRWGVAPQLTFAVMRSESAYQAEAVSPSNGRGLMQLLPSTAERLSGILEEPVPRDEDLFVPAVNVRYGTRYLSMLTSSFGSVPLALAAYNGGPFNVSGLVAALGGVPEDVFVESLPFTETSNYVKRITEAVHAYEHAYLGVGTLPDMTRPVMPPASPPPDF